ncbi:MAG: hypothetical protein AB1568_08680 [Thermodesulfobacteriota bacterium]
MKKTLLVTVALGVGIFALTAGSADAGSAPGSGIKGSRHDLSSTGGYDVGGDAADQASLDRICIYCHAPHHTQDVSSFTASQYSPLWNRPLKGLGTYDLYDNGMNPTQGKHQSQAMTNLNSSAMNLGVSNLCLSCHDGSVALNVYGSTNMNNDLGGSIGGAGAFTAPSTNGPVLDFGTFQIGGSGNLTNHHPVGFEYDQVSALDDEIANADTTDFGTTGVSIRDVLDGGTHMQCSTCHDVHNSTTGMGEKFLWTTDQNSAFCLTCHLK